MLRKLHGNIESMHLRVPKRLQSGPMTRLVIASDFSVEIGGLSLACTTAFLGHGTKFFDTFGDQLCLQRDGM